MTPASVQATLFALADALTIPHPIAMLVFAMISLWVLYKWGAPILLVYALIYFWIGRWNDASTALVVAILLMIVRGGVQILDRLTSPRMRNRPA